MELSYVFRLKKIIHHLRKVTIAEPLNELVETEGSVRVAGTFGDARWIPYVTVILMYGENREELNYQVNSDGSFNIDIPLVRGAGRYTVSLGWNEAARMIEAALEKTIAAGTVTYDLARGMEGSQQMKTSEFGAEVTVNL